MKLPNYNKAELKVITKTAKYRAFADGTDFSKGDILCRVYQLDAETLQPTGVETWTNNDTGVVLGAVPVYGTEVKAFDEKDRIDLGSETVVLTAGDASANPLTVPAGANLAEVSVVAVDAVNGVGGDVLIDVEAVDNTATPQVGHPINCGGKFELESSEELANFQAQVLDATGDNSALHVSYFCQFGQGNM